MTFSDFPIFISEHWVSWDCESNLIGLGLGTISGFILSLSKISNNVLDMLFQEPSLITEQKCEKMWYSNSSSRNSQTVVQN